MIAFYLYILFCITKINLEFLNRWKMVEIISLMKLDIHCARKFPSSRYKDHYNWEEKLASVMKTKALYEEAETWWHLFKFISLNDVQFFSIACIPSAVTPLQSSKFNLNRGGHRLPIMARPSSLNARRLGSSAPIPICLINEQPQKSKFLIW